MLTHRYTKDGKFFSGKILMTETSTIFNPSDEQMIEAGWEVYVEPELTDEQKLWQKKDEIRWKIRQYDESSAVNQFSIGEQHMWLDHNTRQQLKTSIDAYVATGAETVTKWFDGHEYTFPTSTWLAMLAQLEVYAGEAKNVTDAHLAAIEAMDNIEDLEAFNVASGYPEKLKF